MNTKKRLNCYVLSNFIISFLTFNLLVNNSTTNLVAIKSNNVLNKIYEKEKIITDNVIFYSENDNSTNVNTVSLNNQNNQYVASKITSSYVKPSYNSLTGSNLVNYARQFLGLRYVSAGSSLATGTDCSGFTSLIYKEFGISIGRTVSSQIYAGTYVSKADLQPGDLVFYSYGSVASHVAIYMGNGLIIHESTPRDGVKISSVNIMNYITARRLITENVQSPVQIVDSSNVVNPSVSIVVDSSNVVNSSVSINDSDSNNSPSDNINVSNEDEIVVNNSDSINLTESIDDVSSNELNSMIEEKVSEEITEDVKEEENEQIVEEVGESLETESTNINVE